MLSNQNRWPHIETERFGSVRGGRDTLPLCGDGGGGGAGPSYTVADDDDNDVDDDSRFASEVIEKALLIRLIPRHKQRLAVSHFHPRTGRRDRVKYKTNSARL